MNLKIITKNIIQECKLDFGNWAYLIIIFQMPMYLFLRIFNIHNKTYDIKDLYK